jgi:hypothetical protein
MLKHLGRTPERAATIPDTPVSLELTRTQPLHRSDPSPLPNIPWLRKNRSKRTRPNRSISQCHAHCNHKTHLTSTPNPQTQTNRARAANPRTSNELARTGNQGRWLHLHDLQPTDPFDGTEVVVLGDDRDGVRERGGGNPEVVDGPKRTSRMTPPCNSSAVERVAAMALCSVSHRSSSGPEFASEILTVEALLGAPSSLRPTGVRSTGVRSTELMLKSSA